MQAFVPLSFDILRIFPINESNMMEIHRKLFNCAVLLLLFVSKDIVIKAERNGAGDNSGGKLQISNKIRIIYYELQ